MRRRQDEDGGHEVVELAALADGSLEPERRAALEERVAASAELADRLAEQERAVALARSAVAEVEAPASLRADVEARRGVRRTRAARPVVVAAAAAAAVAAVAIGIATLGTGSAAEEFHAALESTELAPGAAGEATLTKTSSGWRIELDATGLPRLDDGRFYQAWLRDAGGALVPIGSFNEGQQVTLWAGVSPRDFPLVSVTRERADGDQGSSGERVLVGTVDTGG